jgi:rhamnosyl/mannosyltransferase
VRLLRNCEADLIHFHLPNAPVELAYLASGIDTPCVATFHAEITRWRPMVSAYAPVARHFLSRMKRVIVSSWPLKENTKRLTSHRDRVTVIPFGIDSEEWSVRSPHADQIRETVGGPIVLCLGRLVHYKGVEMAVEAMRTTDATLIVVGDGGRRRAIESLAARHGLRGRVRLVGEVGNAQRADYYYAADVVVLPAISRGETFGVSLIEAMACGVPVVSTEVGTGTSWVNVNGKTGLVVPPGDPVALSEAFGELLGDAERRTRMGTAARRRVAERYPKDRMLDAIAGVYAAVLDD